ncbi:methyltransferase [Catenulispora sp. EB89]|uniref:class I SAM-dependent methyltransferase n=1 Tax=Catenulispora sp. EB89 TaxID=3156257 RepID=UPI003517DAD9
MEQAIASHRAVRVCAVEEVQTPGPEADVIAYVCPEPSLRDAEWGDQRLAEWRGLYEHTYQGSLAAGDPDLNLAGWLSSYTGSPLKRTDMAAWLDTTEERIAALRPGRVIEVGCGSGMILRRVLKHCTAYSGTDISPTAVDYLQQALDHSPDTTTPLLLWTAPAHQSFTAETEYDTVVMNSVIQYFPSVEYLDKTLELAINATADGGHIFIGDVRSLPLLELFHTSVELLKTRPETEVGSFRAQIQRMADQERELCLSPGYFSMLSRRNPRVTGVRILLKRGRYRNEVSRFRYDVILRIGRTASTEPLSAEEILHWPDSGLPLQSFGERLSAWRGPRLTIREIPNARLSSLIALQHAIAAADPCTPVGEVVTHSNGSTVAGIDPEDLWDLARDNGYHLDLSWSAGNPNGLFDAYFDREPPTGTVHRLEQDLCAYDVSRHANDPLWERLCGALLTELTLDLRESGTKLPDRFAFLHALPETPDGQPDRSALRRLPWDLTMAVPG